MNLRALFDCNALSLEEKDEYYVLKNDIEDVMFIEPEDVEHLVYYDDALDDMRDTITDTLLSLTPLQKEMFSNYFDNAVRDICDAYVYQLDALKVHDEDEEDFHLKVCHDIAVRMNKTIKLYLDDITTAALSVQYGGCEPKLGGS